MLINKSEILLSFPSTVGCGNDQGSWLYGIIPCFFSLFGGLMLRRSSTYSDGANEVQTRNMEAVKCFFSLRNFIAKFYSVLSIPPLMTVFRILNR